MAERPADDPIQITLGVTQVLESMGVSYVIGGSMAGAVHGLARSTMDVDIVADLKDADVAALVASLVDAFYADPVSIREAVRTRRSFNLLHLESMFKVDIFVLPDDPWERSQIARRERVVLGETDREAAYFATAEDTILAKLRWYRMGGEVSDRQWQDVLSIVAVQHDRLDLDYLRAWSRELGVADLLARVLGTESGAT